MIDTYSFPLAPIAEQQRIVDQLETQLTRLDVVFTILKKVRIKLEQYKKTVLNAACTGKLVPTEANLAKEEGRSMSALTRERWIPLL